MTDKNRQVAGPFLKGTLLVRGMSGAMQVRCLFINYRTNAVVRSMTGTKQVRVLSVNVLFHYRSFIHV